MPPSTTSRSKSWSENSDRYYEIDGIDQKLPSVTTILSIINKPALVPWAARRERELVTEASADLYLDTRSTPAMSRPTYVATLTSRVGKQRAYQRELDKAAEIGTSVHELIEWNIRRTLGQRVGPEPKVDERGLWAFMSWQDWAKSVDLTPEYIEIVVYSRIFGYAGRIDLVALVNGERKVVDWKTGKAIYGEALLQNAAYQVALDEMGHGPIKGGLIVRLPKVETDPEFETAKVPPAGELFPVFQAAKTIWEWDRGRR